MFGSTIFRLLKAALLPAVTLSLAHAATAETIRNTASATWRHDDALQSALSNEVSFELQPLQIASATFRRTSGADSVLRVQASCGAATETASQASEGESVPVTETGSYHIGESIIFRFTIPAANLNPSVRDSIDVLISSGVGDVEHLRIEEDLLNSGIFSGSIRTERDSAGVTGDDCRLGVQTESGVTIAALPRGSSSAIASVVVDILADPFGTVFDSATGTPVNGARVTLVDAISGTPATVIGDDGMTSWPSTIISGQDVIDGSGVVHPMDAGGYRFPLAALGSYRLLVEPPLGHAAPSRATPAELRRLQSPDGAEFTITDASYGLAFSLTSQLPIQVDIPLDPPTVMPVLSKVSSRQRAQPGDAVLYTVTVQNPDPVHESRPVTLTDLPSPQLRIRPDSVRVNGAVPEQPAIFSADGRRMELSLDAVGRGDSVRVTYAATVRSNAPAGAADNVATIIDDRGQTASASAAVRVDRDLIAGRMTLIGRITANQCVGGRGIEGVRVLLEDGSFAITDVDGRYHFEGLSPGTHIVQVVEDTLPENGRFADCERSTRSAGSATSRFVTGQGGTLAVADFVATIPEKAFSAATVDAEQEQTDRISAGADVDWLAIGAGPTDWLFPAINYNPRAPATRVVIRHAPGEIIELDIDGRKADPLAYDGSRTAPSGDYAVAIWRGLPLQEGPNQLHAIIRSAEGNVVADLSRTIYFTSAPSRIELVEDRSRLIADGANPPVIVLRVLDRHGRPVRDGISGRLEINEPYESASVIEALQLGQLTRQNSSIPGWIVEGDEGLARIELAPTMVSGPLRLSFTFSDEEVSREQRLETWIEPGDQKWTLVGLAEGSAGARTIDDLMDRTGSVDSDLGENVRLAFYAKGRVLGRFVMTAAFDSMKQEEDQRLHGTLDPNAYYTVFADASARRFDAASREKLYLRIESRNFYAIYGDFQTGFDQTELARYERTFTGIKAEGNFNGVQVQGFAAESLTRHWRDEIQGSGLSGPYALSSRTIVPNSEHVAIEVRDRFRSEILVSRRELVRFVDYDIDLLSGTIQFKQPILSRDFEFNPQFIVIDYERETDRANGSWNGGVRADYSFAEDAVRLGATAITDHDGTVRTDLIAVDVRARISDASELRAEVAGSESSYGSSTAWVVEAEHHDGNLDVLAYARQIGSDFGVGQESTAERGRRKLGVDARYAVDDDWSISASAWQDESMTDLARRRAVELMSVRRTDSTDLRVGMSRFDDRLQTGEHVRSTVLEGGAAQRLMENRLELELSSSIALENADSIDLPARHRFGARYALTPDIRLVGNYEIADGDAIDAQTLSGGIEVTPWTGGRLVSSLGRNRISEFGERSFAAFGLTQSFSLSQFLLIDVTVDGNRTLGSPTNGPLNPDHPVASGGHFGTDGNIFEDFTALTAGGTWRKEFWSISLRGEYRDGEAADRKGISFGAIRQLGGGAVLGSAFTWTIAETEEGAKTEIFDGGISAAFRPDASEIAALAKLEYRSDEVHNAVNGEVSGAYRTALTVTGDAASRRLVGSLSTNWAPNANGSDRSNEGTEVAVFFGGRYSFDSYEEFDLSGFSAFLGVDARVGVAEQFELGVTATVRSSFADGTSEFAIGPQVGFTPTSGILLTVGYNVSGFRDDDFAEMRSTEDGFYAGVRMKFDAGLLTALGVVQ